MSAAAAGRAADHDPRAVGLPTTALSPILIVLGAALLGVLVEAFVPRESASPAQVGDHRRLGAARGARARSSSPAHGTGASVDRSPARSPIDAAGLFLQGTILRARRSCRVLLLAERSVDVGSPIVASGRGRRRLAATTGGWPRSDRMQTEVFPLLLFAVAGMLIFPVVEQPAAHVRRARGAVAAAVPDGRPGPAPPAALAGSRGQVLPARRVRLGVLPLRPGAALRLRRLGRPAEHPAARPRTSGKSDVLLYVGLALLLVGLLFKAGIAPFHSWTPDVYQGAPTPVTAFMAACTKVAAFGAILRVLYVGFGTTRWDWRPIDLGRRDRLDGGRRDLRPDPDRREAHPRLLLDRARRLHPGRRWSR